eukprot:3027957-Pyramimonas_sp.AAC.1
MGAAPNRLPSGPRCGPRGPTSRPRRPKGAIRRGPGGGVVPEWAFEVAGSDDDEISRMLAGLPWLTAHRQVAACVELIDKRSFNSWDRLSLLLSSG